MINSKYLKYTEYLSRKYTPHRKLVVGTDCSGTDAPIQALNLLGVKFDHLFSSDIDSNIRAVIKHNFNPKVIYDDITTRNHKLLPKLDLYVCGFPCQSFSMLGKRRGFDDEIRGSIFFECFSTIKYTQPTVFILENVKGLTHHDKGRTFETILRCLHSLTNYDIYYQILNTMDYGIPQNRERIYIVGINNGGRRPSHFEFPKPIPLQIGVIDVLDTTVDPRYADYVYRPLTIHKIDMLHEMIEIGKIDSLRKPWVVNLNVSSSKRSTPMLNMSPTLLAGHGNDCVFYLTSHQRHLTPTEYLRLQGFHPHFNPPADRKDIYKQAGNAMSVNVLCFLLMSIFESVDFDKRANY